jgi:hypothetical protein
MGSCDLCSVPLGPDARRYSATQVRAAVAAGLRPAGGVADLAAAFGMSEEEMHAGWLQQVRADPSDWSLCPSCGVRTDGFLGTKVRSSAAPAAKAPNIPAPTATPTAAPGNRAPSAQPLLEQRPRGFLARLKSLFG